MEKAGDGVELQRLRATRKAATERNNISEEDRGEKNETQRKIQ